MRYHFTPTRMAIKNTKEKPVKKKTSLGKVAEKLESLYIVVTL